MHVAVPAYRLIMYRLQFHRKNTPGLKISPMFELTPLQPEI